MSNLKFSKLNRYAESGAELYTYPKSFFSYAIAMETQEAYGKPAWSTKSGEIVILG